MEIRFLGHACFELTEGDTRVLVDPFLTGNPKAAVEAGVLDTRRCIQIGLRGSGYAADDFDWQRKVEGWTATKTGPYEPKPYYLRVTKDGQPDRGLHPLGGNQLNVDRGDGEVDDEQHDERDDDVAPAGRRTSGIDLDRIPGEGVNLRPADS